jgi:hypothetical protein
MFKAAILVAYKRQQKSDIWLVEEIKDKVVAKDDVFFKIGLKTIYPIITFSLVNHKLIYINVSEDITI